MAEYLAVSAQEVAANENVIFTNTAVQGNNCIKHREGSGIVTLRGITNQCRARYFVDFSANIAVPTGGTAGAISLAIAISGEPVLSSQMIAPRQLLDNTITYLPASMLMFRPDAVQISLLKTQAHSQSM